MEDGRAFTDYRPSSYVNDLIRIQNKVYDSYSYRQFMIHNGLNIIETNDKYNFLKNGCQSCTYDNIPNESTCVYNKNYGLCMPNGCNGLGQNNYASPYDQPAAYNPGYQVQMPSPTIPVNRKML
jgi:hypothetical protein